MAKNTLRDYVELYDPNLTEMITSIINNADLLSTSETDESLIDEIFSKMYIYYIIKMEFDASWGLTYFERSLKSRYTDITKDIFKHHAKLHFQKNVESIVRELKAKQ